MRVVGIVGHSGQGKTRLITELIPHLKARGVIVGVLKHSSDTHALDRPESDTARIAAAGAPAVAIASGGRAALHLELPRDLDPLAALAHHFAGCDLILVEGLKTGTHPRFEVWRAALGQPPLAASLAGLHGVITDDPLALALPVLARSDLPAIAAALLAASVLLGGSCDDRRHESR